MREILFRAKRIDNGEWVKGYFWRGVDHIYMIPSHVGIGYDDKIKHMSAYAVEVEPETICQYTGLTDKNGNRIWENDILKGYTYPFLCDDKFNYYVIVEWSEEYKYFFLYTIKNPKSTVRGISEGNSELFEDFNSDDWEVIGNNFDDENLLED